MSNEAKFVVVVNLEEQYSIWPSRKEVPSGWSVVQEADSKDNCLEFIDINWTNMVPKSLRQNALN